MPTRVKVGDRLRRVIAGRQKVGGIYEDYSGRQNLLYQRVARPSQGSYTAVSATALTLTKVTTMRSS